MLGQILQCLMATLATTTLVASSNPRASCICGRGLWTRTRRDARTGRGAHVEEEWARQLYIRKLHSGGLIGCECHAKGLSEHLRVAMAKQSGCRIRSDPVVYAISAAADLD